MAHSLEIGPFSFPDPATEPGFLYGGPSPDLLSITSKRTALPYP